MLPAMKYCLDVFASSLLIWFLATTPGVIFANEPDEVAEAATVEVTSLPEIDPAIHDAMQSRSYADAVKLIETALADGGVIAPDYLRYLQGIALTEAEKYDDAIKTLEILERDHPDSDWISRSRFGRAHVYVLRRQYIKAGEIYADEAERLLSRDRKDELAEIYLEFADRYFEGLPADDPTGKRQPDYQQSLAYYTEALKLGPTIILRQKIEFRIARCQEEMNQNEDAIASYGQFIKQHTGDSPESGTPAPTNIQAEAHYRLGAVQLSAAQRAKARKTWQDFLRRWSDREEANESDEIDSLLARAQYRLAHTYGLPQPGSIGDLELAVAAAEKFLANRADHELAPQAELEIAQGYSQHGRHRQSVERLKALIENPKYADSKQIPTARQMLGQEYLKQEMFDEAIAAWNEFLAQHPTDPKWPEVQTWIVDTEFAEGQHSLVRKNYDTARKIWQTFLNKYPLDPRAPSVLLRFGQMKYAEALEDYNDQVNAALEEGESAQTVELSDHSKQLFEEAIVDWRRVVSKYPGRNEASDASYKIGVTLEDRLGNLTEALEAYKKVKGSFADRAKARIARLTSPQLRLVTERKFRSDEKPRIKLTTRNLEKVSVKAYRVDMTDYFRKMHLASGVETLDIALIDPDEQFEHEVDGYEEYKQIEGDIELPIDGPGVTAVTVASEKLEATTMVVVSDLDMIVKSSRNELFLFVENMREEKPAQGVSVLISDGASVFAEELTGEDGVLKKNYDQLKSVDDLRIFAVHEGHVASTVNNLNGLDFAAGLNPRGYLYTDRPAYRGGQLVNIKGIVRWVQQDRLTFKPGEKFKLDVYDARGRRLQTRDVTLNAYGTVAGNLQLPKSAVQGDYRVHLHRPSAGQSDKVGALSFETRFQVTEYKLEPVQIGIDLEKEVYYRGEKVKGKIELKYYYGTPLVGETIQYRFGPDSELVTAKTDDEGKISVEIDTQRFSESQTLQLNVQYPERGLNASNTVFLATRGFAVTASSLRDVFINGESFETLFSVADPAGNPVETDLKIEVFKQTLAAGRQGEKLVETREEKTDADSGQARVTLKLDEGGFFTIRATGVDRFGNDVSGEKQIHISGDKDSTRLRILADRLTYKVGEEATINLHWREQPALALVTFEGASVLGHRIVNLKTGDNSLGIPMESAFAPNFYLSVAVMQRNEFHTAQSEFRVSQKLRVTLKPNQNEIAPGEDLVVEIEVTDSQGEPVQAELSLALVQANLLSAFSDVQGAIETYFGAGHRTTAVRQSTSCTFRYQPSTRGVSQFLLAEADRRATLEREVRALAEMEPDVASGIVAGGVVVSDEFLFDSNGDGLAERTLERLTPSNDMQFDSYAVNGAQTGFDMAFRMQQEMQQQQSLQLGRQSTAGVRVEQRTRTVPIVRYRTEIRDGREVQVPYTENVTQMYSVLVPQPSAAQSGQSVTIGYSAQLGVPNPSVSGPGPGAMGPWGGATSGSWATKVNRQWLDSISTPTQLWDSSAIADHRLGEDVTINALTGSGRLLAVKASGGKELERLAREEGLLILPEMAHAETAFWDPTIVTDDSGKATVTITMPARSTAWRLRSKGINGETLAGQTVADLITKKDLFGQMKLPLAFTVGDRAKVPVEIHNSLDGARTLDVKLKITLGEKTIEQSKKIEVEGPGISNLVFETEIDEADQAVFELNVSGGDDVTDKTTRSVDVRPYGFPVYATASGASSQSTLAMLQLDQELQAEGESLEILIGASINRSLLESVTGGYFPIFRCGLPTASPIERSVSDVIGGVSLLKMIGQGRNADTPEAQALTGRISSSVTQLISAQREDGGWAWTGTSQGGDADAYLTSRVMWALSAARNAGFAVASEPYDKGKAFLQSSFASATQSDLERQTILLHAMALSRCGDFAFANRLYRERNRLSPSGLTYLALTLAAMNHAEMANDLIDLIKIPVDDAKPSVSGGLPVVPWMRNPAELQAMYLLALQEVRPNHPDVSKLAKSLMSARVGSRWPVEKSNGPAIAALASWHSRAQHESEKYTLTVAVNDQEIETLTIDPAKDGSRRIEIPAEVLRSEEPQRIEFQLDGRATFSYSAVLTGFVAADKITSTTKTWTVSRRYEPAQQIFDGRTVPRGFNVVNGSYRSFANPLTQIPVGERGEVTLFPRRHEVTSRAGEQYDYLVLTEPIPAGCSVLDGSVTGGFERFEIQPGQITFYIGAQRYPSDIRYTLLGYVPGTYRAAQSILRSFYEPSKFAVSKVKQIDVLPSGSKTADEYKLTPDELYYLGEKQFAKGDHSAAHSHLTELYENWRLDADKFKNTVRWLFLSSLTKNDHGDTVNYFEVLKEKLPDVELSFENILSVAKSYREIGEYERGYLVYRATVEGSFERESQVAGFLNARGEFIRGVQAMERLLRDYPAESYVATATYALAQETYRRAPTSNDDEKLKATGLTRVHLIRGAIEMLDHFITTWPEDPADDQASFALATALIDLEKYDAAITRSEKYAQRYPNSRLLDSFWYMIGYSHFELQRPEQALEMCRKVAEATFPVPETGGVRTADNRWEAIYIMGQIYHSLGNAANAIAEYTKVRERFVDAAEAIRFFSRQEISLDEVTAIKPDEAKKVELKFRNIAEAAIKVYRIDLMKFGLMQRNLDQITAINLAGIKPYHEETVKLGDGKDFRDRTRELDLPLKEEGAYLIVCRGENLYTSGLALISPLELSVQEDATSGRVRVSVKNSSDDQFVNDVHVKVIGAANEDFVSGDTDLRGLFIADDIQGTSTVIAVSDSDRYAFYRGDVPLQGILPEPTDVEESFDEQNAAEAQPAPKPSKAMGKSILRDNLFNQNGLFQREQQDNLEGLFNNDRSGIKSKEAY